MKNPISTTGGPGWIELVDRDGKKIYGHPKATVHDLVRAGVRSIRICKPEAPLAANEYRDSGKTKCADQQCAKYRNLRGGCDLCGAPCL